MLRDVLMPYHYAVVRGALYDARLRISALRVVDYRRCAPSHHQLTSELLLLLHFLRV